MQNSPIPDSAGATLSEPARLIDVFVAPSKTFHDVLRTARWWAPLLVSASVSLLNAYVLLHRVGMATLVDGVLRSSAALESQISNAAPAQAALIRSRMELQFHLMYIAPVFWLILGLIVAGVLLATANFGFGGRARYPQMLAVWFYGTLPLAFISIITMVLVSAGVGTEAFNIKNAAGTNIGYFLQDGSSPRWLVTLLSSVDVFAIWAAIVLTIGVSVVAGIKRSAAAAVVFGWWFLYVMGQTAIAAVSG